MVWLEIWAFELLSCWIVLCCLIIVVSMLLFAWTIHFGWIVFLLWMFMVRLALPDSELQCLNSASYHLSRPFRLLALFFDRMSQLFNSGDNLYQQAVRWIEVSYTRRGLKIWRQSRLFNAWHKNKYLIVSSDPFDSRDFNSKLEALANKPILFSKRTQNIPNSQNELRRESSLKKLK